MAIKSDNESEVNDSVSPGDRVPAPPPAGRSAWWRQAGRLGVSGRFAAHPLMFGCWCVLQGYAELEPTCSLGELVVVLAVVAGAISVLQLALIRLMRHPRKPALLTSLCVVFFCFFGDWQTRVLSWTNHTPWSRLGSGTWLLPLTGAVFLALCLWLYRTPRALVRTRRYLDVVATLLAGLALVSAGRGYSDRVFPPGKLAGVPLSVGGHPPDIYYILADARTSPESLKAYWGYDDSGFVNYLTGAGFRVLENARGNATFTPACLATYLDMNYPPEPPPRAQSMAAHVAYYCQIIRQAEAPARLKASGYDMRMYSIFDVAGTPHYYTYPIITNPTLATSLWRGTALGHIHAFRVRLTLGDTNLKIISLLPRIAAERSARPKFVYAHLMMPHPPYLFDKDGRRIRRGLGRNDDRPEDYLGQLIYENSLLTNAVAGILRNSQTPPVIIIQGDHGYRAWPGPHRSEEAVTILNALYLPGSEADWLYPGLTPVNTFRVLFNHYFGEHYGYLPDIVPSDMNRFVDGARND